MKGELFLGELAFFVWSGVGEIRHGAGLLSVSAE